MIDVTLPDGFPIDLARICQPSAKVYFPKLKEFGTVTKFMDTVEVRLDQGKSSSTKSFGRDEFISLLQSDEIVAKSRVVLPEDDNKPMRIKPRLAVATSNVAALPTPNRPVEIPKPITVAENDLLTGYIDEKTGKFSPTLQKGFTEIQYRKVTRKVSLELDSVQLQKLKELGIIE